MKRRRARSVHDSHRSAGTPVAMGGMRAVPDAAHVLDLIPGMVLYIGADLIYRYANAAYAAWWGLTPAAIVGRDIRDVIDPVSLPVVLARLTPALAGDGGTYEYDVAADGGTARMQGVFTPDVGADGQVAGVVLVVTRLSERPDLRLRIEQTEAMFGHAFREAPFGMFVIGDDGRIQRANRALGRILGRPAAALSGMSFTTMTHPDDVPGDLRAFEEAAARTSGYRRNKRYIRPDGSMVHCRLSISMVRDAGGRLLHCVGQVEDETEERAAARRAHEANARLSMAMEAIHGGFWHLNLADGRFVPSPALIAYIEGAGAEKVPDMPYDANWYRSRMIADTDVEGVLAKLTAGRVETQRAEYRLRTWSGVRWVRSERRLLRGADGRPHQIVGVIIDQTDERARRRAAEVEADTDMLTGLLNRRGLQRRMARRAAMQMDGPTGGVLAIDMDRFKAINDRFGHAAGDAVLATVGDRLRTVMREQDLVARIGGDEFVVVMDRADPALLDAVAGRAAAALARPVPWQGGTIAISASIGGAAMTDAADALDAALIRADAALYGAKDADRRDGGGWQVDHDDYMS